VTDRNIVLFIVLISIILTVGLIVLLPTNDRTMINIIGIVGFILSILGLAIAYIQIMSVKNIAEQTRNQVIAIIELSNDMLMISDLSRKAAMVDEIQRYLKDNKIELCILRMKDLKIILNSLKNHEQYNSLFKKNKFNLVFQTFNINLDNCQQHNLNEKSKINKISIIQNLEELSTLLMSVEVKLKNISHD
jgi:phosphate/sulfate permease